MKGYAKGNKLCNIVHTSAIKAAIMQSYYFEEHLFKIVQDDCSDDIIIQAAMEMLLSVRIWLDHIKAVICYQTCRAAVARQKVYSY